MFKGKWSAKPAIRTSSEEKGPNKKGPKAGVSNTRLGRPMRGGRSPSEKENDQGNHGKDRPERRSA